jgi:probable rRNA maturation factor
MALPICFQPGRFQDCLFLETAILRAGILTMVILEKRVNGVAAAELSRFVRRAQTLAKVSGEVGVLVTGNARLKQLNRRFRRKNKPTDVLSFPRPQGGDIAISADIARENARLYGHRSADELKILILHGMLHLAGYDHESDHGRMAAREARLRTQLKLPASLIDRTNSRTTKSATVSTGVKRQPAKAGVHKSAARKAVARKSDSTRRSHP